MQCCWASIKAVSELFFKMKGIVLFSKSLIKHSVNKILFCILIVWGLCGCAPIGLEKFHNGETVKLTAAMSINGLQRTALVHIPKGYDEKKVYPLIIVIHGAFSTAAKMEQETGFSKLADREGVVVVYPNGMGIFGLLQHWNAGHCCGKAAAEGLDDIAFLEECISFVKRSVSIDDKKVYVTGFSNGGMMAHRFAAEKSHSVTALAALGASVGGRPDAQQQFWLPPMPEIPVPALLIHGMDDTAVPPAGGVSLSKGTTREYLSLKDSTTFWLRANRCLQDADSTVIDNGRVEKKIWTLCAGSSSVEVYRLNGWGHRWPGGHYRSAGGEEISFQGTEMIWKFFQRHTR